MVAGANVWRRRRLGRGCLAVAASLLVLAGVAACGDDDTPRSGDSEEVAAEEPERPTVQEARPYSVETFTETFVDQSRPTDDPAGERNADSRTLETDVYVPGGTGPFPLIVHAHGNAGQASKYTELLTTWAEAGYVVAAPTFPLTNDRDQQPSILGDYTNQPADVAFVIEEILALASGDHETLAGRVDPELIGVSGHSLGGITLYGLLFNDCCRRGWDDRIDAAIVLSSMPLPFGTDDYAFEGTPLMLILGADDPTIPYDTASETYDEAATPKYLATIETGEHFQLYEDAPSDHDQVVKDMTTAFWDLHLFDDAGAAERLTGAADSSDATELTSEP